MQEYIGLRPKLYSYKMFEDSTKRKKCKGIKKNVIKHRITHDDYKNCLFTKQEQMRTMNVIRSRFHNVSTEKVNKVALSA